MRSISEGGRVVHWEKSRTSRPSLTCLEITHEMGATWLYQGQAVRLEWQSWHDRSRILPICGLIISAVCVLVAEILETAVVGTNCIPRKTKRSKIGINLASLGMILYLMHAKYIGWTRCLSSSGQAEVNYLCRVGCNAVDLQERDLICWGKTVTHAMVDRRDHLGTTGRSGSGSSTARSKLGRFPVPGLNMTGSHARACIRALRRVSNPG